MEFMQANCNCKGKPFRRDQHGFTLVELLVVIAIIGILIALLLPFLEQGTVDNVFQYDYRLLDNMNRDATSQQISIYLCPSDDAAGRAWHHTSYDHYFSRSNYVACFGSNTLAVNTRGTGRTTAQTYSNGDLSTNGAFQSNMGRKIRDITDGTSKTGLISEVCAGKDDEGYSASSPNDGRGLWAWPIAGACAYTHLNTPNTSALDVLYYHSCVHMPQLNLPCMPMGNAWEISTMASLSPWIRKY